MIDDTRNLGDIKSLIELNANEEIIDLLSELHPADIAELINNLEKKEQRKVFALLSLEIASEVIPKLDENSRRQILFDTPPDRLTRIVGRLETDDAADIIGALSDDRADAILEEIDKEESEAVQKLLRYGKETAGGIMQTELISVKDSIDVEGAINHIRSLGEKVEDFHNVFVADEDNRLTGILPLRKLILATAGAKISDIMTVDPTRVNVDVDQEEVARVIQKYDLVSVPVTDDSGVLLGRITIDDVVDVMEEETSEDFLKMAGMGEIEELVYGPKILKISQKRLPWLLINLVGGLLTGYLMWFFETTIRNALTLVTFIPVITGMGGNVGIQASSIVIRGMAIGRIDLAHMRSVLLKEVKIGALMGFVCACAVGLVAPFWHGTPVLGVIVGFSMFVAITVAATMGALIPAIFKKSNIDPAIASGPFVTTANDITGIVIYLSTATLFLKYIV